MDVKQFVTENISSLYELLARIAPIPAPSHKEDERAAFVLSWLREQGAEDAYIDSAKNVVYPIGCEGSNEISVICAHTDTVFPDLEPLPYSDDGEIIKCPGIGDDTASLVVLLFAAKYFIEANIKPRGGIIFLANSCEEGLGNLKGTRKLFEDYSGRIKKFISFDSCISSIDDRCVGSTRYEVTVRTEGGHSYQSFGNSNAIAELSRIVGKIYEIEPPKKEGFRATYNVGEISGGTSVNTIAESARMLCEYRSDNYEFLQVMKEKFYSIFDSVKREGVEVEVKCVGDRPCEKGVSRDEVNTLVKLASDIIRDVTGEAPKTKSASTDCNIPLSLGIPAICIGVYRGGGAHKREEWIEKSSLVPGLEIGIRTALELVK